MGKQEKERQGGQEAEQKGDGGERQGAAAVVWGRRGRQA